MSLRSPLRTLIALASLASAALLVPLAAPAYAASAYVLTTFKGDAAADQELWVYSSGNATSFDPLVDTNYRGPTGALRDPSVIRHNGAYYIAYTVQSWTTQSRQFAIARSTDLRTWSHVATVEAGVPGVAYTWAPEFLVEGGTVRVVVSVGGADYRFTPYVYTASDASLTSWSAPRALGIPGNHIDTFILKPGAWTYNAFVKNETTKYIEHWTSTNLTDWTDHGTLFASGHEGPSLLRQPDGRFRIFVDRYPTSGMWTATSADLWSWTSLSAVACSGCRHGTVLYDTGFAG